MKINNITKTTLITDVDNTLFDWFDMWFSTFDTLLSGIVKITGLNRGMLISEIKLIHQKYGTAEYTFMLQELPSLLVMYKNKEAILENLNPAIVASQKNRRKRLKLYNGVYDTLSELKCRGTKIIAFTESKQWYTQYRLKKFGLDYFIDTVFTPKDHERHELMLSKEKIESIKFTWLKFDETPKNELKPDKKLLLDIIEKVGSKPEDCVYIGDSQMKDIEMAYGAGVTSVFAKYGNSHFAERQADYDLLKAVTHWTEETVRREDQIRLNNEKHKANFEVDCFSEILNHITFTKFTK